MARVSVGLRQRMSQFEPPPPNESPPPVPLTEEELSANTFTLDNSSTRTTHSFSISTVSDLCLQGTRYNPRNTLTLLNPQRINLEPEPEDQINCECRCCNVEDQSQAGNTREYITHGPFLARCIQNDQVDILERLENFEQMPECLPDVAGGIKLVEYCAVVGAWRCLQLFVRKCRHSVTSTTLDYICNHGNLEALRQFAVKPKRNKPSLLPSYKGVDLAAQNGHLEIIQFVFGELHMMEFSVDACDNAAANGHLDIVAYLVGVYKSNRLQMLYRYKAEASVLVKEAEGNGCRCLGSLCECPRCYGHRNIQDLCVFADPLRTTCITEYALIGAMDNNKSLAVVCTLIRLGAPVTEQVTMSAAGNGRVDILRVLVNDYGVSTGGPDIMDQACFSGSLETVQFIYNSMGRYKNSQSPICSSRAVWFAACSLNVKILKFLYKNYPVSKETQEMWSTAENIAEEVGDRFRKWLIDNEPITNSFCLFLHKVKTVSPKQKDTNKIRVLLMKQAKKLRS